MSLESLIQAHRADIAELTGLAERDLDLFWQGLAGASAVAIRDALMDVLPQLIETYGAAAATLGADWYEEVREELDIPGRFTAVTPEVVVEPDRIGALARWGTSAMFVAKHAEPFVRRDGAEVTRPMILSEARSTSLTQVKGGMQRAIVDFDRLSVMGSAVDDPRSDGWQRKANGGCAFCQMLAGRGEVYTEAGADFASHDNCGCVAVPSFSGQPKPVKPYTPSLRESTEADRARVRAYLKANYS